MLAFEANGVIGLRLMKIAGGGVDAGREIILMVQEKIEAAAEAQTTLMGGGMLRLSLLAIGCARRSMRSGYQRGRLVSRFIKMRLAQFREHVPRCGANSSRELARSLLRAPWDKSTFNSRYAVKTRGAFRENQGDRASIAHRSPDRSSRSPL